MAKVTGRLWQFFRKSFRLPTKEDHFIGSDHLGNKYYEKLADESRGKRASRWVETSDGDQEATPDIPLEWDSWLRRRRKEPPTQEMIDQNYLYMLRTQHRAKELEMKDKMEKEKMVHQNENMSFTASIKGTSDQRKFPVHEELEIKSGRKLNS